MLEAFATDLEGSLLRPDDEAYAQSVSLWNGMIAQAAGDRRSGRIGRRRRPNGAIRRRARDRAVDPGRGPQHRRPGALRRRDDPGHVRSQCRRGGFGSTPRSRPGRRAPRRRRPRDPAARTGRHPRLRLAHRRRRTDAGRRFRLPDPTLRVDGGRPGGGVGRPCRRLSHSSVAQRERRPVLGASWRRRQLRGRDGLHVPPARGRTADHRRTDRVAGLGG